MISLNCAGKYLDLSRVQVMGVLNVTPNSFSAMGRFSCVDAALRHAEQMVADGAAMIDVGGEATNPGVYPITSLPEELDRVIPVIEALVRELPIPISVDTSKPQVMHEAIQRGIGFINDIRALRNMEALKILATADVAVCLMHMAFPEGKPLVTDDTPFNSDLVNSVRDFLQQRVDACIAAGISQDRIVIDPGIGHGSFGKNLQQNLILLASLNEFKVMNKPILVGVSRKTFIGEILHMPVEERLYGSLGATVMAVNNGANLIRTHDVRATVHAIRVAEAILVEAHH